MLLRIVLLFLAVLISTSSNAESCPSGQSFCEIYGTEISAVYINQFGEALIGLPTIDGWLQLGNVQNDDIVKSMYSSALAIKASNSKRAWVRWNSSTRKVIVVSLDWK